MINVSMECDFDIPKWDVALEALMREECVNNDKSLNLADIERLADTYSIRFDDLMVTVLELVVHKCWQYKTLKGKVINITQKELDQLYCGGRIKKKEVVHLTGFWRPKEEHKS